MDYDKLNKIAKETFKIEKLKDKQLEIFNEIIINRRDVCAVLPTGFGKSLCYQLPSVYMTDHPVIVISPLLSLMEDQKLYLDKVGVSCCCYNSTLKNRNKIRDEIEENKYQIIFMTPEYTVKCQSLFEYLHAEYELALVCIDESHCISSWGSTFRESYKELECIKRWLPDVPILALTATATKQVEADICKSLNLENPEIVKTSFDRPNLYLSAHSKTGYVDLLKYFIGKDKKIIKRPSIIYCKTRKVTEAIEKYLTDVGVTCASYHGGMDMSDRTQVHHDFLNDKKSCIIATISFGMGINKSNIRLIIHYGAPKDMEAYYQEIGRAGRDNMPSECVIYHNRSDFAINRMFLKDIKDIKYRNHSEKILKKMESYLYSSKCRRKEILGYFDEDYKGENEKCCDNCTKLSQVDETEDAKDQIDNSEEASLLLGLVAEIEIIWGLTMYINILRGSKNKKISADLYESKYYNKGGQFPVSFWTHLGQTLLNCGYLEEKSSRKSFGSTLKISKKGSDWMKSANKKYYL